MELLAQVLGACIVAVGSGFMGLRVLLYITNCFIAIYSAWSINRALFHPMCSQLALVLSRPNAIVITFLILTTVPIIVTVYLGLMMLKKLGIDRDHPSKTYNSALGCGFGLAVYICIITVW